MTTTYFLAHALSDFNLPPVSLHGLPETVQPGTEFRVDAARIESTRDARGFAWLDLLDDEPAQVNLWGAVRVRRGPAPPELRRPRPGFDADELREARRQEIHKNPDEVEKQRELAELSASDPRPTSRTVATYR